MNNKKNIYLMYLIIFLQGFVFYGPVSTIYRQSRGLSLSQIFLIESISWLLIIILEMPWGWFSDKFGYKKTLIIVNLLFFISKIIFYISDSFFLFLSERILLSIVLSGLSGCDSALIYSSIKKDESQKVFGRYSAFGTLGFLFASLLSIFIIPISLDYTALFTIIPYLMALIATLFLDEIKTEDKQKLNLSLSFKEAFIDKSIIIFIISIALNIEVFQAITVFLNQAQYIKSGIDPKYFGIILAFIQVSRLISAKSNYISQKLGDYKTIIIMNFLLVLCCLFLIFTSNPIVSIVLILIISLSVSVIGPIEMDVKNRAIKTSNRATILSIYSMVASVIASIVNIIIGKTSNQSLGLGLMTCLVISIISLLMMIVYSNKLTKTQSK